MSCHVFVLCPPYSGSTILWRLVGTSEAVSRLPDEGQCIPTVKPVMVKDPWAQERKLPWPFIKQAWERYWDLDKDVLLEKSPPNLLHARDMQDAFRPAYFLVMVRNPYATCEGIMRRRKWDATRTAKFAVRLMRKQRENLETLEHALRLTYEELADDPAATCRKIEAFVPGLSALRPRYKFRVHAIDGLRRRGIVNLNARKIGNLSPEEMKQITAVLERHRDLMDYWGYEMLAPTRRHAVSHAVTRTLLFLSTPYRKGLEVLVMIWWQVKIRFRRRR